MQERLKYYRVNDILTIMNIIELRQKYEGFSRPTVLPQGYSFGDNRTMYTSLPLHREYDESSDVRKSYEHFCDHVNDTISYLNKEEWGISHMVPSAIAEVVKNDKIVYGLDCRVVLPYEGGSFDVAHFSPPAVEQLAKLYQGLTRMVVHARLNKQPIAIPEILQFHPFNESVLGNLMENSEGKIYVTNLYPLRIFRHRFSKRDRTQYAEKTIVATNHLENQSVQEAAWNFANDLKR